MRYTIKQRSFHKLDHKGTLMRCLSLFLCLLDLFVCQFNIHVNVIAPLSMFVVFFGALRLLFLYFDNTNVLIQLENRDCSWKQRVWSCHVPFPRTMAQVCQEATLLVLKPPMRKTGIASLIWHTTTNATKSWKTEFLTE